MNFQVFLRYISNNKIAKQLLLTLNNLMFLYTIRNSKKMLNLCKYKLRKKLAICNKALNKF